MPQLKYHLLLNFMMPEEARSESGTSGIRFNHYFSRSISLQCRL